MSLEPSYRRAQLWRNIKKRVHEQIAPIVIIDEAR